MPFDWEQQKTNFKKKLTVSSFGPVNTIIGHNDQIVTNHTTIDYRDCAPNAVNVQEAVLGPTHNVSLGGGTPVWTLPWQAGWAARTVLGAGGPSVFLTPSLNGCGVMIGGPAGTPTVVHANAQAPALLGPVQDNLPLYLRLWSDVYTTVASQLVSKGYLPDLNLDLLQPSDYLAAGVANASVFGVRAGANWSFYVVVNKAAGGATRKIWG